MSAPSIGVFLRQVNATHDPLSLMPIALRFLAMFLVLTGMAIAGQTPRQTPQAQQDNSQDMELARSGLERVMDGDLEAAIEAFHKIQETDTQSPLGYLLEGDAVWWRIYYATADLVDPDVFDVVSSETTPYDSHFQDLVNTAIHKSEARIHENQDVARNYLYEGLAYALRARLEGLRGRDRPTARAGKKMRGLLLKALELDPNLIDAYLGTGIYNYFVDTLPTIVKILRIFMAIPGGSREVGLQQLRQAADTGELIHGEAKFYLAKDFSRPNEKQYAKSLELFQELAREYPHNPLWPMLVGSLHFRLSEPQEGEAAYLEVLKRTAGQNSEVNAALHQAALMALRRRHPDEKFGD